MRARTAHLLLSIAYAAVFAFPACAGDQGTPKCSAWLEPFPIHQPYLITDPRTGLMLYVESDNRHIAAITRDGKVVWHRNLFDDPKIRGSFVPPPPLPGEEPLSAVA